MPRHLIFINSHPIQYFAPLYTFLARQGVSLEVCYCSDENVGGHKDRQFGAHVRWDIPLLEGYSFRFFKNIAVRPTLYAGFFGLINPGLWWYLLRQPRAVVVVHGWAYATHLISICIARLRGHTVCIRGENPLNQELMLPVWKRLIKKMLLVPILSIADRLLYIGSQNKLFYEYYGVRKDKLIQVPYAVDNSRMATTASLLPDKATLRRELGLPPGAHLFLFVGKFIPKKRPMDVIHAFARLSGDFCLVCVGEGELRNQMEAFVSDHGMADVYLPGFKNQTEVTRYYAACDTLVLPSGQGETWGLVVNEAMNFDLSLVVSDVPGSGFDLIAEGINGTRYPCGQVDELRAAMERSKELKGHMGRQFLEKYSFEAVATSLKSLLS